MTLKNRVQSFFDDTAFVKNRAVISESNLKFYRLFNYMMIALLSMLYASTFFISYADDLKLVYIVFILLTVLDLVVLHVVNKRHIPWGDYICYYGIAKAYLFCLFSSVICNPDDAAITYLVFLILLAVSFLIRPWVMIGMQTAALLVFCVTTAVCKPAAIARGDILSCFLFYSISIVIGGQIGKLRMGNISLAETEHEHSIELENQRDLLSVAMKISNLCAWEYDCATKRLTPTYTPETYSAFHQIIENMPEDIIAQGMVHPDSVEAIRTIYRCADAGEPIVQGDMRIRSTGEKLYRWFHIVMIPQNGQEKFVKYIGTSEDITERKNTEQRYEDQLRILDSANEENLITKGRWNLTENRQEVKRQYSSLSLALHEEETYDYAMMILTESIFPEEKKQELRRALDRTALIEAFHRGIDRYSFEYQRTAASQEIWVNMQMRLCQVPGKEDVMAFGFSYDVTEEVLNRNIVSRLVAVEYDFMGTVNVNTGHSIMRSMQNSEGKVIDERIMRTVGVFGENMDYEKSVEMAVRLAVVPEEQEMVLEACHLKNVRAQLEDNLSYMVPYSTIENGLRRRKKLEYCYLNHAKDTILYFRSDITEIYQREQEQLSRTEKALETARRASDAKTEFFSRMSHDMRTPMNGILGLTNLSEQETDTAVLKENIRKIQTSGEYLLGLINDTLDFQKIESGRMTLEPQIVSAQELVDSVLSLLHDSAAKKGISIQLDCEHADLDCFVKVDPMRLKQVFLNLMSNAIKFTASGGTVSVSFVCSGQTGNILHDVITVSDTGIGMSEEFLQNGIFQPFSQEYNGVVTNYAGSGLGLSIVKKLVELMHGSISVKSQRGVGTSFTVKLDLELAAEAEVVRSAKSAKQQQTMLRETLAGKHILLAEDHPLNAEIAQKLLARVGCTAQWVKNGRECVAAFSDAKPQQYDVILMDIRMPDMDGLEAARQIRAMERADAKTIPILAMTANAYDEDVKQSMEAGMNDHLAKPIDPMTLYQAIADQLISQKHS